jgi:predicted Zn-dependent protease with MMP-like domain
VDHPDFEFIARQAVEALPKKIRDALGDVVIVIEDRPSGRRRGLLLGLYEGVPLTEWGRDYSGKLPDRITLYREPIETVAGSPEEVPRVIRETVWHEVAHHFGLGHDRISPMEKRWQQAERRRKEAAGE